MDFPSHAFFKVHSSDLRRCLVSDFFFQFLGDLLKNSFGNYEGFLVAFEAVGAPSKPTLRCQCAARGAAKRRCPERWLNLLPWHLLGSRSCCG